MDNDGVSVMFTQTQYQSCDDRGNLRRMIASGRFAGLTDDLCIVVDSREWLHQIMPQLGRRGVYTAAFLRERMGHRVLARLVGLRCRRQP